jgi:uncharacterized membrane protein YfcA
MFDGGWLAPTLVVAGALAGGFANGLTGFGTALTGLPIWLQAVEPLIAAQLASACGVVSQVATMPAVWRSIDWRHLAPMLIAGLLGVPFGTWVLPYVSLTAFRLGVGVLLIGYCSFMLLAPGRLVLTGRSRTADAFVGFAGGILGGLAGLSGALPTVWATLQAWSKDERRAVFQAFNLTILSAMLLTSLVQGLIGWRFVAAGALALPGTLIGSWWGSRLYRRLDDRRFDRLVLLLLLVSGLGLVSWNQ